MNTLSSFCIQSPASVRVRSGVLTAEAKTFRRPGVRVLLVIVFCAAFQPFAAAQQQPNRPLIDPSEMRHKSARVAVTTPPAQTGRWDTLPQSMPINPVHVALMHNNKILVVAGSGNDPDNRNFQAGVWNISNRTVTTFPLAWDMFCSGMVILPSGRPFILGGTLSYNPFLGERHTAIFDPLSGQFANAAQMNGGRWYPTGTVLGDGSVLVVSGSTDTSTDINQSVQIWNGNQWRDAGRVFLPLYPRQHLLENGKVFEDGPNPNSKMYDPATGSWTDVAMTNLPSNRKYGTSVLLPLSPTNDYKPTVMILGGANQIDDTKFEPATDTTELIDLSVNQPRWVNGPMMDRPRVELNATILPNGRVLVSGGSAKNEVGTPDSLSAQLYNPDSNSFSPAGSMMFQRLYHSNTILLPDATVMAVGNNPDNFPGGYETHIEIYSPPYLFDPDNSLASRPVITGTTPSVIHYGATFRISTAAAGSIRDVVLIRPGAVTHSFDMEQRLVRLNFTVGNGVLSAVAPPIGNIAPPGYYMVFILKDC